MVKPDTSDKGLFNPLDHDFTFEWLDDTNTARTLKIPSHDVVYFSPSQFNFMKKHLIDEILNGREFKNHELAFKEAEGEVVV